MCIGRVTRTSNRQVSGDGLGRCALASRAAAASSFFVCCLLTECTVSDDTPQTLTTPSPEAEASFLPLADHASAVTSVLWLVLVLLLLLLLLEPTRFLRVKSDACGGAVLGRLLIGCQATDTLAWLSTQTSAVGAVCGWATQCRH